MKYRKEIKEYLDNSKGIEFQSKIPSTKAPKKVEMFVLTLLKPLMIKTCQNEGLVFYPVIILISI